MHKHKMRPETIARHRAERTVQRKRMRADLIKRLKALDREQPNFIWAEFLADHGIEPGHC